MIRFDHLTFQYPASPRPALDRVSATIEPGAVTLVTGPLGAGCSTLLLVAAGLAPHVTGGQVTSGGVATLGADPTTAEGRRALAGRVGLLLSRPWTQLSGMAFTVSEEIAFGPANLGWDRGRIAEAVDQAMALTGVTHLEDRDPTTLSGGELQRVMLAGVAAMEPALYLLDEPALELDPAGAESV
ncbi:MAG: ABC transporter ATP-binding protein, partial [Gemmatimonadetes bacterium]|nr:ABC transporter ATP-binding protein [Gemmatimonadota bacterium]